MNRTGFFVALHERMKRPTDSCHNVHNSPLTAAEFITFTTKFIHYFGRKNSNTCPSNPEVPTKIDCPTRKKLLRSMTAMMCEVSTVTQFHKFCKIRHHKK